MSYFDHVRCHACKAMLDPESLGNVQGQGPSCPRCNAPLSLTDLFGLKAAFAEEDEPDPSLDDLVPGAPARPASPPPGRSGPRASSPRGGTSLVPSTPAEEPSGGSALDLMRQMKKR